MRKKDKTPKELEVEGSVRFTPPDIIQGVEVPPYFFPVIDWYFSHENEKFDAATANNTFTSFVVYAQELGALKRKEINENEWKWEIKPELLPAEEAKIISNGQYYNHFKTEDVSEYLPNSIKAVKVKEKELKLTNALWDIVKDRGWVAPKNELSLMDELLHAKSYAPLAVGTVVGGLVITQNILIGAIGAAAGLVGVTIGQRQADARTKKIKNKDITHWWGQAKSYYKFRVNLPDNHAYELEENKFSFVTAWKAAFGLDVK